jgi:uncharacterized radical SAM superfamily Fe-S cluster-containing enzyme
MERDGAAWLQKTCPEHGFQEVMVAASAAWYQRTRRFPLRPPRSTEIKRTVDLGCPFDCGPCTEHQVDLAMPVITITSACNLDCPICYVHNRNDGAWHMSLEDFVKTLGHIQSAKGRQIDLLNLTGGEPLLHPRFLELARAAKDFGINRISACSNGLKLRDPALVQQLADLGVRVALSFDTFDASVDIAMQGVALLQAKMRCLDLLDRYGVDVTLIPVMTRGYNHTEIGRILQMAMDRRCVRHVEVHMITYTGQSGVSFDRSGRICMDEVLTEIELQTPWLRASDFVPSPWAHPLCYQICFLLLGEDGPPIPFTRFLDPQIFYDCLSENLYLEPSPLLEKSLREAIDRLWVEGGPEADQILDRLKRLLQDTFPSDKSMSYEARLRASEKHIKAIYLHSHMDEESMDLERLAACCDASCYPDGSRYPVCAYNVLYREKDPSFVKDPAPWGARSGGWKPR